MDLPVSLSNFHLNDLEFLSLSYILLVFQGEKTTGDDAYDTLETGQEGESGPARCKHRYCDSF